MKNLYPHPDKKGRYIYLRRGKYVAERRHSMGFRQTNIFYTIEEAVNWLLNKWPEGLLLTQTPTQTLHHQGHQDNNQVL